jgi:hypothetical protein
MNWWEEKYHNFEHLDSKGRPRDKSKMGPVARRRAEMAEQWRQQELEKQQGKQVDGITLFNEENNHILKNTGLYLTYNDCPGYKVPTLGYSQIFYNPNSPSVVTLFPNGHMSFDFGYETIKQDSKGRVKLSLEPNNDSRKRLNMDYVLAMAFVENKNDFQYVGTKSREYGAERKNTLKVFGKPRVLDLMWCKDKPLYIKDKNYFYEISPNRVFDLATPDCVPMLDTQTGKVIRPDTKYVLFTKRNASPLYYCWGGVLNQVQRVFAYEWGYKRMKKEFFEEWDELDEFTVCREMDNYVNCVNNNLLYKGRYKVAWFIEDLPKYNFTKYWVLDPDSPNGAEDWVDSHTEFNS